jgi:glycosyltransferase involved in cell wall biosynthesis
LTLAVHFLGPTLTAVGRPYLAIFPNASLLVCRGLLVFVMFDGTLLSFAYGMLLGSIASIPIYIWLQTRFLAFPATQFLNAQVKSLYVTLLVLSLGLLIKETLPADTTPYRIFLLLGLLAPPTWWIGLRIFDHPFRYEVLSLIGNRRKGNRKGKPAPVGVLIPMKYPDSIGYVWRNVARQRDLVAQALLPRLQCYAAYPLLTGQASYKPEYMQAVELDCFNQNNLRNDKLLQFIRDNNIRVAFLMSEPANSQLTHYLQACGIATLTTENDSFDLDRRQSVVTAWSKWLLRSAFKKQIHCLHLANARKQYDFLHRFAKIPKLNLDIVHNGVNTEQFTPDAPPSTLFGLPDDPQKIWLISVAQARPIKRIPYLLEIFAELRQCRPGLNIGLIYVGSGDDLDNYKNLAAELGISKHVVFAGHQSDLTGLYTATDIYVHTAELESFGMAVAEAMASELAVVCTHAAGPAELIMDNVCGRLVPKEDREQLIQAILAYVDDPALRLEHGKAARQRIVTHYSQALQIRRLAANVKKVSQRVTRND